MKTIRLKASLEMWSIINGDEVAYIAKLRKIRLKRLNVNILTTTAATVAAAADDVHIESEKSQYVNRLSK